MGIHRYTIVGLVHLCYFLSVSEFRSTLEVHEISQTYVLILNFSLLSISLLSA